ncbi:hypothetical protein [Streptomyces sp. NPDC088755]|uniref:hypothetical protein n=1 Tax=Streptomyces sp. NPDC088755 TaxID=3365888 RepID=UPI0037FE1441
MPPEQGGCRPCRRSASVLPAVREAWRAWGPRAPGGPGGSGGLWNRNFRYFFVARTVALFGDGMIPVALTAGLLGAGRPASSVGFALAAWLLVAAAVINMGVVAVLLVARPIRRLRRMGYG